MTKKRSREQPRLAASTGGKTESSVFPSPVYNQNQTKVNRFLRRIAAMGGTWKKGRGPPNPRPRTQVKPSAGKSRPGSKPSIQLNQTSVNQFRQKKEKPRGHHSRLQPEEKQNHRSFQVQYTTKTKPESTSFFTEFAAIGDIANQGKCPGEFQHFSTKRGPRPASVRVPMFNSKPREERGVFPQSFLSSLLSNNVARIRVTTRCAGRL